jgi:hypothetical protein
MKNDCIQNDCIQNDCRQNDSRFNDCRKKDEDSMSLEEMTIGKDCRLNNLENTAVEKNDS